MNCSDLKSGYSHVMTFKVRNTPPLCTLFLSDSISTLWKGILQLLTLTFPCTSDKYTEYRHMKTKSLILSGPNSNPSPKQIFGMWKKRLSFVADSHVKNALKCPRIYLPNLSAQHKNWDFIEKRLHWASVVHG